MRKNLRTIILLITIVLSFSLRKEAYGKCPNDNSNTFLTSPNDVQISFCQLKGCFVTVDVVSVIEQTFSIFRDTNFDIALSLYSDAGITFPTAIRQGNTCDTGVYEVGLSTTIKTSLILLTQPLLHLYEI